jgi:hypothetical protein
MRDLQFLAAAYAFGTFRTLSAKELAGLTAAQKAQYDALLAQFITDFKARFPKGYPVEVDILKLGTLYAAKNRKGVMVAQAAIVMDTDEEPAFVSDVITQSVGQLDILAKGVGFPSWQVLAMNAASHLNKGKLRFTMNVRVEGETVSDRKGKGTIINKTHIAQDDFEYTLSPALQAMQLKTVSKASEQLFIDMMNNDPLAGLNQQVVEDSKPDGAEDIVNP